MTLHPAVGGHDQRESGGLIGETGSHPQARSLEAEVPKLGSTSAAERASCRRARPVVNPGEPVAKHYKTLPGPVAPPTCRGRWPTGRRHLPRNSRTQGGANGGPRSPPRACDVGFGGPSRTGAFLGGERLRSPLLPLYPDRFSIPPYDLCFQPQEQEWQP